MSLLRRAALRAVTFQPSILATSQRSFIKRTSNSSRVVQLSSRWQTWNMQKRFASDEASPTDAQTTGETVPSEGAASPSEPEYFDETADAAEHAQSEPSGIEELKEAATPTAAPSGRAQGASYFTPEPSKILYVGNLFFETTSQDLEKEFAHCGTIVNCKVATDNNGLSKGYGFVEFDTLDSANVAIDRMDQEVIDGRRVAVQYHIRRERAQESSQKNTPSSTLFIGNISYQMSDKDLNDLFRKCKNVTDVRVAIDRRSGQPRGFAHADFVDTASAQNAMEMLRDVELYGRKLRIDYGKRQRSFGNVGRNN